MSRIYDWIGHGRKAQKGSIRNKREIQHRIEVQDMDILGMQHEANACRVGNSVVPMFGVGRMEDDVCLSANQCLSLIHI